MFALILIKHSHVLSYLSALPPHYTAEINCPTPLYFTARPNVRGPDVAGRWSGAAEADVRECNPRPTAAIRHQTE